MDDGGSDDASAPVPEDAGATAAPASPCGGVTPRAQLLYNYIDTSTVFATSLLQQPQAAREPRSDGANHETLMYALAGRAVLFGTRDGSRPRAKCYAPDPVEPDDCGDPASLLNYNAFETDELARSSTSSTRSARCSAIRRLTTRSRT